MQADVKTDVRHPSVNGTMSQFFNVKIVAVIFVKSAFVCYCLLLSNLYIPKFVLEF